MKKILTTGVVIFILLLNVITMAQVPVPVSETRQSTIAATSLLITYGKTTNLIFPYSIKSVDKGSKEVLVQVAKGVENILQVKAARQGFSETNLTVVTADGKLYSYVLNYTDQPVPLNIKLGSNQNYPASDALFSYKTDNEARVYDLTEQIANRKPVIFNIKSSNNDVTISLTGVYIKDDKLYCQFKLENNSNIDYTIDAFRLFIKDQKKSKRTASQEIALTPLQQSGNIEIIRGRSQQQAVIVLPKFTIPDKKVLVVQLMEQHGGRHLELKIKNKTIIGAREIWR